MGDPLVPEAKRDLDTLVLVFSRHLLDDLARADGELRDDERAMVEALAPTSRLRAAGLVDDEGRYTAAWHAARTEALERLADELPRDDKLALLTRLVELSIVDGDIDRDEGSLLVLAATLLGLPPSTLDGVLDALTEHVGDLDSELLESE